MDRDIRRRNVERLERMLKAATDESEQHTGGRRLGTTVASHGYHGFTTTTAAGMLRVRFGSGGKRCSQRCTVRSGWIKLLVDQTRCDLPPCQVHIS
jgi:hypothetical protein